MADLLTAASDIFTATADGGFRQRSIDPEIAYKRRAMDLEPDPASFALAAPRLHFEREAFAPAKEVMDEGQILGYARDHYECYHTGDEAFAGTSPRAITGRPPGMPPYAAPSSAGAGAGRGIRKTSVRRPERLQARIPQSSSGAVR